jgi:lysozyme
LIPILVSLHSGRADGDCSPGLRGIDVSTFNGPVDWAQAVDSGLSFAFAKASEGLTIHDDRFAANWAGMKASGVVRGAYHFFRADDDGAAQADVFLGCVGSFEEGDLPPVLDWETSTDVDATTTIAAAHAFVAEVQKLTGLPTIIYTTVGYWSSLGDPGDFAQNPLWIASDETMCPTPPPPWTDWLFWQHSAQGAVPGLSGAVDLDWFAGSVDELRMLAGVAATLDAGLTPPGDAGVDAGVSPAVDAGISPPNDAGTSDAGAPNSPLTVDEEASPPAGCEEGAGAPPASSFAILALLLVRLRRRYQVRR